MEKINDNAKNNSKKNTLVYDKAYHREYYKLKKTEIKERASVKIPCSFCNKMIQKQHMSKHKKTAACKIHASYKLQIDELKNQ